MMFKSDFNHLVNSYSSLFYDYFKLEIIVYLSVELDYSLSSSAIENLTQILYRLVQCTLIPKSINIHNTYQSHIILLINILTQYLIILNNIKII